MKLITLTFFILLTNISIFGQLEKGDRSTRGPFLFANYQILNDNYIEVGLGYHINRVINWNYVDDKTYFEGFILDFKKNVNNNDLAIGTKYLFHNGYYKSPFSMGIGLSYNLENEKNHIFGSFLFGVSVKNFSLLINATAPFTDKENNGRMELILGYRIRLNKVTPR